MAFTDLRMQCTQKAPQFTSEGQETLAVLFPSSNRIDRETIANIVLFSRDLCRITI